MKSLKNLFNFFHDQGRVDNLVSAVSGFAATGAGLAVIGIATGNIPLAVAGGIVELGTIAVGAPLIFAGDKFRPRAFAAASTLALAAVFGLSAALPLPATDATPTATAQATSNSATLVRPQAAV